MAGYSGPREQVHRQINQKIQCGFRPRVGLASTRHVRHLWLLLPCPQSSAAAAPTAVPGASVATRVSQGEGPSIHWEEAPWREHCRPECPRGGALCATSNHPAEVIPTRSKEVVQTEGWVPEHSFWP